MSKATLPSKRRVGGVGFTPLSPAAAAAAVVSLAQMGTPAHIHLANAYTIALADEKRAYQDLLNTGLVFADGKPISWVSRARRDRVRVQQVRGPGLFEDVIDEGRTAGLRHYFLGASEGTLNALVAELSSRFDGAVIAGYHSPPFRDPTDDELSDRDERIRVAQADIVWVGLGTPKQDIEASRLAQSLGCVAVAVGAAFDFTAGTSPVAPLWMQRAGLEWVFRLKTEPRRLWRRYLLGNPRFVWCVVRDAVADVWRGRGSDAQP